VLPGTKPPPSLINIYKELNHDLGCTIPRHGGLIHWAEQGVLLLNTVLTVRDNEPGSHRGKGWETFTDQVIRLLDAKQESLVFMLWGSHAQQKEKLIQSNRHFIIRSPHPSPLSSYRGFFGSRPFSQANQFLLKSGQKEINWQL
jgi:uracil-DNA glycosylase